MTPLFLEHVTPLTILQMVLDLLLLVGLLVIYRHLKALDPERLARLERQLASLEGDEKSGAAPPPPSKASDAPHPHSPHTSRYEEVQHSLTRPKRERRDAGTSDMGHKDPVLLKERILKMAAEGRDQEEIARETGLTQGEVELVLAIGRASRLEIDH